MPSCGASADTRCRTPADAMAHRGHGMPSGGARPTAPRPCVAEQASSRFPVRASMPGSSIHGRRSLDARLSRVRVAKRQRIGTNALHERKAGF